MVTNHVSANPIINTIDCIMQYYVLYITKEKQLPDCHTPSIIRHSLISARLKRTSQNQRIRCLSHKLLPRIKRGNISKVFSAWHNVSAR